MATLETRLRDLATRIGTESKALRTLLNGNAADLAALTITTALGNRVRVDTAAQGLTAQQKTNARTNIGADVTSTETGNTDADLVAAFNAALV
jgi:hypothetical protein